MAGTVQQQQAHNAPPPRCAPTQPHPAWPLLLQHACLRGAGDVGCAQTICQLMCVSRGMLECLSHHLAGLLDVTLASSSRLPGLVPWLSSHAGLLRSLAVPPPAAGGGHLRSGEHHQAARLVVGGLTAALASGSSSRPPLPLQALCLSAVGDELLQRLARPPGASATLPHLTRLELGPFCELATACSSTPAQPEAAAAASSGLMASPLAAASLPALRSLVLHGEAADALLPMLAACSQVTSLQLNRLSCRQVAQLGASVPVQLLQLLLVVDPDFSSWARKRPQPALAHLTALTELQATGEGLFAVQTHEVLPPGLRKLVLSDCPKALPLLALARLEDLVMTASTMPAAELQQVALRLRGPLRAMRLGYDRGNPEAIGAAAPGWRALAGLRECELDMRVYPGPLTADTLQHMAALGSGLTRLAISGFNVAVEATPAVFGAVLGRLQGLRELKLGYLRLQGSSNSRGPAAAGAIPAPAASTAAAAAAAAPPAPLAAAGIAAVRRLSSNSGSDSDTSSSSSGSGGSRASSSTSSSSSGASASVHEGAAGDADMLLLMERIAALPSLVSLSLHSLQLGGSAAVRALAAATRLTSLQLNECDIHSEDVAVLAASLSRLHKLSLNWNFKLKTKRLGTALSPLTALRELQVCCGCPRVHGLLAELQEQLPLLRLST